MRASTDNPIPRALAAAAALGGGEAMLARLTSVPQHVVDVAASLGLLGAVFSVGALLSTRGARGRIAGWTVQALATAAVCWGVVGPAAVDGGGGELAGALVLSVAAAWGAWRLRDDRVVGVGPWEAIGALALAIAAAWSLEPAIAPVEAIARLVATLLALGAVAHAGPRSWPAIAGCAAVAAWWPATIDAPVWDAEGDASGPDLVLITVDTLRADQAAKMESWSRLAAAGASTLDATAASPWTLPSMAAVMTGQPVRGHGARREKGAFAAVRADVPMLAEQLAARGYDTAAVVAPNPWLGASFGFSRGFAHFDHLRDASIGALPRGRYAGGRARPTVARWLTAAGALPERPHGEAFDVVERASETLADRRSGRPLFLWVHLLDPHLPYTHAVDLDELSHAERVALTSLSRREVVGGRTALDRSVIEAAYRHEVEVVDRAILRLLDELGPEPANGRVVALTADHGEELWDHGGFEHGHALWQEVVGVPLVLVGGPRQLDEPAAPLDVHDHLLRAAGLSPPRQPTPRMLVVENLMHGADPAAQRAVRVGELKLVLTGDQAALYDLGADPGEQHDLSAERADAVARLRAALARGDDAPAGAVVDLTGDLGLLRALGYVE